MDKKLKWGLFSGIILSIFIYIVSRHQCQFQSTLETPEVVIKQENYPVETHTVETEDGYFLTLHRIPKPLGVPVYLQHGLLSSSMDWLKNGKNRSLAFYLWDNGYDVWIGNSRGNTHSRTHKFLSPKDRQFWNFSWHEMGIYDDAAFVNHVAKVTEKKVFYVAYSMGAASFSIMASLRPNVAKNVAAMIALAPAVYISNIESTFARILSKFWRQLQFLAELVNMHEFLSHNIIIDIFADKICRIPIFGSWLCSNIIFVFVGPEQLDYARLPIYFSKWPSGTSYKAFSHILQLIAADEFQNFDYGQEKNLAIYNNALPPKYDLSKIQVPIAMFISKADPFINYKDALRYYNQLPRKLGLYYVDHPFIHGDFIIGMNATEIIYNKIIKVIDEVVQTYT